MWIVMAILGLSFQNLSAKECLSQEDGCHSSELSFLTIPENLQFDHGNIFLNVEGLFYSVSSLKKIGDQWLATVFNANSLNYCVRGHMLCRGCKLCHDPRCWYYIRPCNLWNDK